jgi:hypothetical protein
VRTRRFFVLLFLLPIFGVVPAHAGSPGDGTLSVRDGKGLVQLSSRGTMIGRIERGKLTVTDPNPFDARKPIVLGAESRTRSRNMKTTVYRGRDIRLRVTGGLAHVRFEGRGIQLSAVGRGAGLIQAAPQPVKVPVSNGFWSLNDEEYQPLPEELTRFQLVGPPPPEQG